MKTLGIVGAVALLGIIAVSDVAASGGSAAFMVDLPPVKRTTTRDFKVIVYGLQPDTLVTLSHECYYPHPGIPYPEADAGLSYGSPAKTAAKQFIYGGVATWDATMDTSSLIKVGGCVLSVAGPHGNISKTMLIVESPDFNNSGWTGNHHELNSVSVSHGVASVTWNHHPFGLWKRLGKNDRVVTYKATICTSRGKSELTYTVQAKPAVVPVFIDGEIFKIPAVPHIRVSGIPRGHDILGAQVDIRYSTNEVYSIQTGDLITCFD